jgi:alpha-amylase
MRECTDKRLFKDWTYLQTNDHFYYMSTKFFSDGEVHKSFNPYGNPYEAFINYMNVVSDFSFRLNALVPKSIGDQKITELKENAVGKSGKVTLKEPVRGRREKENLSDTTAKKTTTKGKRVKSVKTVEKKRTGSDIIKQ